MNDLPDYPGVWSTGEDGGFRQRWMSQAFGKHESIIGIQRYRVLEEEWEITEEDKILRTIFKAEII
jgi:hypothetical protein